MSYTLKYTGQEIDDILDRANEGGALDVAIAAEQARAEAAEALKAPIDSPAFTGIPTAPIPAAGDDSTKVATTGFVAGEIRTEASSRDAAIADAISEEVTARNAAIEAAISTEVTNRNAAISAAVSAEQTRAESAEADLAESIEAVKAQALSAYPTDTASGSIASFADGAEDVAVKSLIAQIEPIQNLNGYDHPWPAGGGKNKLRLYSRTQMKSYNAGGTWDNDTYTYNGVTFACVFDSDTRLVSVTLSGTASADTSIELLQTTTVENFAGMVLNGCPASGGASKYRLILGMNSSPYTEWAVDNGSGATINSSATGTASLGFYIKSGIDMSGKILLPMISADGGDFAPYSNICPISGFTGAQITRTGKNLWNGKYVNTAFTVEGDSPSGSNCAGNLAMRIKEGSQYTFSVNGVATPTRYLFRDEFGNALTNFYTASTTNAAPTGAKYLMWRNNSSDQYADVSSSGMIEEGPTATAYEPYNGTVYSVSWQDEAGTVYGGELNVTTGVLTVTFTKITLDGTLNWTLATGSMVGTGIAYREYDNLTKSTNYREKIFATTLKTAGNNSVSLLTEYSISGYVDYSSQWAEKNWIYVNVGAGKTAEEIKAWFGENPTDVVYELATPQIFQLDPVEVKTWLADNNITANTGDVLVVYRAGTKLYVDKKIAELQALVLEQ